MRRTLHETNPYNIKELKSSVTSYDDKIESREKVKRKFFVGKEERKSFVVDI